MRASLTVILVCAAVVVVYATSYCLMVRPGYEYHTGGDALWRRDPVYRFGDAWAPYLYQPLIALDQMLFPKRWFRPVIKEHRPDFLIAGVK